MAGILGVLVLALYGDRSLYYQDPYNYQGGYTKLTPLGEQQELQLGAFLRNSYISPGSPLAINSIKPDLVDDRQVQVRADNGGERGAVVNSAIALLQGLYPPTPRSRTELANGTTVVGPFGGYQYISIETVEPQQSIDLEGWTACPKFETHVRDFYDSPQFKQKAKEAEPFLAELKPFLFGIPNTLENIWNVFDYMRYNYVHNETYAYRLPPTFLEQTRALVAFHEHGVFTDKKSDGLGNIAGRTIIPSVIGELERIANKNDPLVLALQEISYKPLISLFNITGLDVRYPELKGFPNYGSVLAFELRNNDEGETFVRTKFKNGSAEDSFRTIHLWNHKEDVALTELVYRLNLAAVHSVPQWCKECGQRVERGCNLCAPDDILIPQLGGNDRLTLESGSCKTFLGVREQDWPYLAVITAAFFTVFGVMKMWKSRKPRLSGYDPLPTTVQYLDHPDMQKHRF